MKWIGITGGIGTGKSTVAEIIRERGLSIVDADQVAREVVQPGSPGLQSVVDQFGSQVLNQDQSLDRQALAQIVFQDPKKLELLEQILHPLIQARVAHYKERFRASGASFAFYDIPLLFEKNMKNQFDLVIVVNAPREQIIERLRRRNKWSSQEIESRIRAQIPLDQKIAAADFVVQNDGDLAHLREQVMAIVSKIELKS
ncbi:MAG TPA: dephospho-CoA kinase [Pseudobdellovibrionaceae bacterium]|nr:dephospho-CoA kinase [Pseudobdellovibrionaceae bacterium]